MAVTFNDLLEGVNLSESARQSIQEAWDARLTEARDQLTAELREEFAQRYEHDKGLIIEGVENFIETKVANEIAELREDTASLVAERVKYQKAISEHAKLLDQFVTEQVAKEVRELHQDRQRVSEHLTKLDGFVAEQLSEELKEFHADKRALVEQKVKMAREGKQQLAEAKRQMIERGSRKIQETVSRVIAKEIKVFKEDITQARENDFGRKIFEAFASEYNTSYMNELKEVKKAQAQIQQLAKKLKESQQQFQTQTESVKLTESKLRIAQDKLNRKTKLDELMRPLGKEKREIMMDLLESVKTDRLEQAFTKYLPSVLNETVNPTTERKKLSESVTQAHTGNKPVAQVAETVDNAEIVELNQIRKLAGITKQ
jgi:hypothetical protein